MFWGTSYHDARTLQYLTGGLNPVLEWMRFPGDVLFIVGGVLPIVYLCSLGVRYVSIRRAAEVPPQLLFTEAEEARAR